MIESLPQNGPSTRPTQWDDLPLVLSLKQVATVLGIGKRQANERCLDGTIPSQKCGGRRIVSRDQLRAWIESANSQGGQRP